MTDQAINIEDLTPGTRVKVRGGTILGLEYGPHVRVQFDGSSSYDVIEPGSIESIISRPETDAEKIARLEAELADAQTAFKEALDRFGDDVVHLRAELAERDARIAELEADRELADDHAPARETAPIQWSDPIEGPPPKGLPAGSYQIRLKGLDWGAPCHSHAVYRATYSWCNEPWEHRIAMNKPITWEGGECPVPGDWAVVPVTTDGVSLGKGRAKWFVWNLPAHDQSRITSFTLTSDGGK